VFGQCLGARLPVPVYETAFAMARRLEDSGERERVKITVVSPSTLEAELGDSRAAGAIEKALTAQQIEFVPNFSITSVTENSALTDGGEALEFNLLMLVPPFRGPSAASFMGAMDHEGYLNVDLKMRVLGLEKIYAVGDCVNFDGPKMGHMAVRQGEIAAANLASEIAGHEPALRYQHEMRVVIDAAGDDTVYLYKDMDTNDPSTVRQGRFWSWAKRAQQQYWEFGARRGVSPKSL
jgi:sulfide:quinone oxidoreductase